MKYRDVQPDNLNTLLETDGLTIIDMRDEATRARGQLPNAMPQTDALIHRLVQQRRSNPPVLVYCYHGNSSRELCSFLGQFGMEQVYNLAGGWAAWESWQQQRPALDSQHTARLAQQGFEPDSLNSGVELGMSPLMLAALKGEHELVGALLAAGADPAQLNDDEHHALWFACVNGDVGLVKTLIDAGSDINNRNVNGVTCVIYAASTGKLDVLKTLVAANADLHITTDDGISVMESAATLEVLRYLRFLLRRAS